MYIMTVNELQRVTQGENIITSPRTQKAKDHPNSRHDLT